jgi:hypothetical protein
MNPKNYLATDEHGYTQMKKESVGFIRVSSVFIRGSSLVEVQR